MLTTLLQMEGKWQFPSAFDEVELTTSFYGLLLDCRVFQMTRALFKLLVYIKT